MDDAPQVTRRLVEEVATSTDGGGGVGLSFSRHREGLSKGTSCPVTVSHLPTEAHPHDEQP